MLYARAQRGSCPSTCRGLSFRGGGLQKIHALPLRKAAPDGGSSLEDDVEREAWKQLVSTWRSRVSCVGAEIVHITADIRLSPILEKLRGASPVDPDDGEPSPRADPAQNSCEYERSDSTFSVEIQYCD